MYFNKYIIIRSRKYVNDFLNAAIDTCYWGKNPGMNILPFKTLNIREQFSKNYFASKSFQDVSDGWMRKKLKLSIFWK